MKKQNVILFTITFALIAATAGLCQFMTGDRKLGNPGVKVVSIPSFDPEGRIVRKQSVDLPERVIGFDSKADTISEIELQTLPADTLFGRRTYRSSGNFYVTTSVVLMGEDSRSIHKPEICLPSQGWSVTEQATIIRMKEPVPYDLPVMKVIGSKDVTTKSGKTQTVKTVFVYWFVADKQITADHLTRMWRMGKEMLKSGTLQRWAYIACIAHCYPGQEEETYKRVEDFIISAVPEFQLAVGKPLKADIQTASK
jgi:hypothetical protein